jgi:two-component system response regulator HydG
MIEHTRYGIVGESTGIRRLRLLIETAAPTRLAVLIQGPTGSGKELVAGALHTASGRAGAFIPFNVCAIGDTMFEDALFGHARGSYTGAVSDHPGFLLEAHGGTAFFDEISGLPLPLQAKLLRAIETGQFRPIGARQDVRSDFRVVSATNETIDELVANKRFRADLAHRLSGVILYVPPLADRLEDVPHLVSHFLSAIDRNISTSSGALRALQAYSWPGNVRELRQVVEWAAVLSSGSLTEDSVTRALSQRLTPAPSGDSVLLARREIHETLVRHGWDTDAASRELGIHRATLYRRMKRLRISVPPSWLTRRDTEGSSSQLDPLGRPRLTS